jgi:hypothetical protein
MNRYQILSQRLAELLAEKVLAVGGRLRQINRQITNIENVLIREQNYPESVPFLIGVDGEQNGWRLFPVVEDGKPKLKVQYLNDGEFLDCGEFVCLV